MIRVTRWIWRLSQSASVLAISGGGMLSRAHLTLRRRATGSGWAVHRTLRGEVQAGHMH